MLGSAEVADFEGYNTGFAIGQLGFGFVRSAELCNGAIILCAETFAQAHGLGFAVFKVGGNSDENHDDEYNRGQSELGIREVIKHSVELKLHCILLCGASATVRTVGETLTELMLGVEMRQC
jgi:hypothetical protein